MQQFTSKNTSVNKSQTPKIYKEVQKRVGWIQNTVNLDIGGGKYDILTEKLSNEHNVTNLILDPFNRSPEHNEAVISSIQDRKPDTVTLSNVLCVIQEKEVRAKILEQAKDSLKDDGVLFVTAYEGNKSGVGKQTGKDQYQLNQPIDFYLDEIKEYFAIAERKGPLIIAKK